MRILVFEYITGGGLLEEDLPQSLASEGDLMLQALVRDLSLIPGIQVYITRDARLPPLSLPVQELRLKTGDNINQALPELFRGIDAVWPIAPESQGILEQLSRQVLKAGKILLNSPPSAVSLAASKKHTAQRLSAHGISVAPVYFRFDVIPDWPGPWIVKPDDGVGCEGIRIYADLASARQDSSQGILQPYFSGTDASLSMICNKGAARLLSVNRQHIVRTGNRLGLTHCISNGIRGNRRRFENLANEIARAIPDFWGYIGVDLLLGEEDFTVLEINPRLTSSYVGLADALGINPAEQVLSLLEQAVDCNSKRTLEHAHVV